MGFKLKDHLGDVRAVVGDVKIPENEISSTRGVKPFFADVKTVSDYYPFGMTIAERSYSGGSYRYGYNGKEQDNEVKGEGNSLDFGERIFDPRITKFLSLDPLRKQYPWWSPYLYAGNTPIMAIDKLGKSIFLSNTTILQFIDPALALPLPGEIVLPPVTISMPNEVQLVQPKVDNMTSSSKIDWALDPPQSPEALGDEWIETTDDRNTKGKNREFENIETG